MHLVFRPRLFGGLIAIAALRLHFEISRRRDLAALKGSAVFYVVQAVIPSLAYHKLRCSELVHNFQPEAPAVHLTKWRFPVRFASSNT